MNIILPRRLPTHRATRPLPRAPRQNENTRMMRNPLRDRRVRAFSTRTLGNSRGGTRTRDPGIMSAVL